MLVSIKQKYKILKSPNKDLHLKIHNKNLEVIEKTKYLCVAIKNSLNWKDGDIIYHILDNIYESSHHVILTSQMEKLESIQNSAALALTGTWSGTSREKLYDELGWEPLHLRRWSKRLILFFKIFNNWTPDNTRYPIPILQITKYDLHRHTTIGQICCKKERLYIRFLS